MRGVGEGERLRQQVDNAARPEAPSAAVMEIDLCFKIPSTVHVNTTMKQVTFVSGRLHIMMRSAVGSTAVNYNPL